jgi:hypothetical protein
MPGCVMTKSGNDSRTMLDYSDLYNIVFSLIIHQLHEKPIPMTARSKSQVCSGFISGISGSNPVEVMDVLLLCLFFVLCR